MCFALVCLTRVQSGKGKTGCDLVKTKKKGGGSAGRRERDISERASQIVRENEISFAAGTLSDDTRGACLSVCVCIHMCAHINDIYIYMNELQDCSSGGLCVLSVSFLSVASVTSDSK